VPGKYSVALAKRVEGVVTPVGDAQPFEVVALGLASLPAADRPALLQFQQKTARLQRAAMGAVEAAKEAENRIKHVKLSLLDTPAADPALGAQVRALEPRLKEITVALSGDDVLQARNEPVPPSITDRIDAIVASQWTSSGAPTRTNLDAYAIAAEAFAVQLERLRTLVEVDLRKIEDAMEAAGAPWTPGRVPVWRPE
jgi:hypothetical protein